MARRGSRVPVGPSRLDTPSRELPATPNALSPKAARSLAHSAVHHGFRVDMQVVAFAAVIGLLALSVHRVWLLSDSQAVLDVRLR